MAKYLLTNKAVEDLSKIYDYTFEFWSENQADKYYEELINFCQLLTENPMIGRKTDFDENIRVKIVRDYLLFYKYYSL